MLAFDQHSSLRAVQVVMDSPTIHDEGERIPPPRRRMTRSKKTPLSRIYRFLVSRLSGPLLTSLLLLPTLQSTSSNDTTHNHQHNNHAVFELVPFYRSLKCLVLTSPRATKTPRYRRDVQQWLSYWTLYAFIRFLEATRCNVSTTQERRKAVQDALDRVTGLLGSRLGKLFSMRGKTSDAIAAASQQPTASRAMTLATQLAGSPTRWTVIKALLLFYAMDEELQGARRIMEKVIKPIFGFFTSLDDEDDAEEVEIVEERRHQHPARRTRVSPVEEGGSVLKLNLEERQASHNDDNDDEPIHTPSTPELSMDGSCGGSEDSRSHVHVHDDMDSATTVILLSKQGVLDNASVGAATWRTETIAVEGNHWIR